MEKILTFSIAAYNVEKYLDKLLKTMKWLRYWLLMMDLRIVLLR